MVANRASIIEQGTKLAKIVLEGDPTTADASMIAARLLRACQTGGSYKKKYESNEERVLMRHLNLYRNKLTKAKTDVDRIIWRDKLREQEKKVARFRAEQRSEEMDLDGL